MVTDFRKFIRTSDVKTLKIQSISSPKDIKPLEEIKAFLYSDCIIFIDESNPKECHFVPLPMALIIKDKSIISSFGSESVTLVLDFIENGEDKRFGITFDNKEECNIWILQLNKLEVTEVKTPIVSSKVQANAVTIQAGEPGFQLAIRRKKINLQFRVAAEKQAGIDQIEKENEKSQNVAQAKIQELEKQLKEIQNQLSKAKSEMKTLTDAKNDLMKQKSALRKDLSSYLTQLDQLDAKLMKEYLHEDAQLFEVTLGSDPMEKEVATQLRSPQQQLVSPKKEDSVTSSSSESMSRTRSKTTIEKSKPSETSTNETSQEGEEKEKKRSRLGSIFAIKKTKDNNG